MIDKIIQPSAVSIYAQSEELGEYIGVQITKEVKGTVYVATEIKFDKKDKNARYGPTVLLPWGGADEHNPAQKLMDSLWKTGLRPSSFKDSRSTHEAMTKHLDDMRKIVSKKLSVDL